MGDRRGSGDLEVVEGFLVFSCIFAEVLFIVAD